MQIQWEQVDIVEESSVTVRGYRHRTTVPSKIFHRLKIQDKDKLQWTLLKDGTLIVTKITQ